MRRGNPHTFHTSTSPLAVLSPFFLRVLEKIIYAPTAYTSYTPAFLLPRYLHTLSRADSRSRTPAAPPLRLSHAKCVISSTCPPTPPSPPSTTPPSAVFFVFPIKVHFYCASAAVVQVRPRTYCCPTSCDIFLSPT
jgi:hypothetical protein